MVPYDTISKCLVTSVNLFTNFKIRGILDFNGFSKEEYYGRAFFIKSDNKR